MSSTNNNGIDNVPPAVGLVSPPPFAAPPVAAAPGFFSPPPRPSMAVLQAQLAHATAQLGQANARVAVLETDVTLLTNNVEELEVNVEELEDSVGDLQDDIHDLERNRPRRRNPDRGANKKQKVEAIGHSTKIALMLPSNLSWLIILGRLTGFCIRPPKGVSESSSRNSSTLPCLNSNSSTMMLTS